MANQLQTNLNLKEITKKEPEKKNEDVVLKELMNHQQHFNKINKEINQSFKLPVIFLLVTSFIMLSGIFLGIMNIESIPNKQLVHNMPKIVQPEMNTLSLAPTQKLSSREIRDMAESKVQKLFLFDVEHYKRQIVNMDENFYSEDMTSFITLLEQGHYLEQLKNNGGYSLENSTDVPIIQSINYIKGEYIYKVDVPVVEKWIPNMKKYPTIEKKNIVQLTLKPSSIKQYELLISDINIKEKQ